MSEIIKISEEIHDLEENSVTVSRVGDDVIHEITVATPMALMGAAATATMGLPFEVVLGVSGFAFASFMATGTYASMQKLGGDYIEMISPKRSLLTWKEQMKAWAFLPGKEIRRTLETYYVKDKKSTAAKRLNSGLIFGMSRVPESEATHKVTHEVRSSWRGAKIVQTIEPVEDFLWEKALQDTAELFEFPVPKIKGELKDVEGATMAERIKAIESQTAKSLTA